MRSLRRILLCVLLVALHTLVAWPAPGLLPAHAANPTLFSNNFDGQSAGALTTGSDPNLFTSTRGGSNLAVQTTTANSSPNALSVNVAGGGNYYAEKDYTTHYVQHELTWRLYLGADFALGRQADLVLAKLVPSSSTSAGTVNVTLSDGGRHSDTNVIRIDYLDSTGTDHDLSQSAYTVTAGAWHTIDVSETIGGGSGVLTLKVDGTTAASGSNLDLGQTGVESFLLGDAYSPANAGTSGHLYVDDVTATGTTVQSGQIPWHPHKTVRLTEGLSASVDLADGHVDVAADDLSVPARGPALTEGHVWDSTLSQAGVAGSAGQGWQTSLTPSMGGPLTSTVSFTDATGAVWLFPYTGAPTAPPPYTTYQTPAGLPWALSTSTAGYTLTNALNGQTLVFDAQGRYLATADAYGNQNSVSPGASGPTSVTNSGGRALSLAYSNGLLSDVQSPLWRSSGGAQGQHVTYGYNGSGQLTTLTRGAGTTDALTTTFGYSGTQLISVTTPYTQATRTWTLSYDPTGRLVSITSPISGTAGQAGYTPAYTTSISYSGGTTQVVDGAGTSGALTTTYTLDAAGEATQSTDGLGASSSATYDADHDVLSSTDANGNVTTNSYQYVGPNGSTGLLTQTVQPKIRAYSPLNGTLDNPTTVHKYNASNDLIETDLPEGGTELFGYDTHHGVITTTQTTANATTWQGTVNQRDAFGELTGVVDGRGVSVSSSGVATLAANAGSYTRHLSYTGSGDLASDSTAPITTTLGGVTTASTPVTTTYGYDGDGDQTSVISANGTTTTTGYDHLGRPVTTTLPTLTLYTGANLAPVQTTGYDGEGNVVRQVDGNGDVSVRSFDPLGRAVSETNAVGATTLITYSATQKVAQQDTMGNVTAYNYDAAGQLTQVVDPLGTTMQMGHDAVGNTTVITTGAGTTAIQVDTLHYDALNEVVTKTVSGPGTLAQTTQTSYDHDGNVVQVQQPNGDVTYASHDLADQRAALEIDPAPVADATGSTQQTAAFDNAGNRSASVDFDNREHATTFDGDNRAVQSADSLSNQSGTTTITTTEGFDPDGNVLSQSMQTAGQTHTYTATVNAADWRGSTSDDGLLTAYGYDGAGRLRTQTVLGGAPVTTTLDAAGRATAIGESVGGTTPYTSAFGYNANDLPVTMTVPGGVQETRQYDAASRLTTVSATGPTGVATPLNSTYSYGYNALNWTTGLTSTLNGITSSQVITHDALGRLTGAQGAGTTQSWTYDGNGNLTTSVTNGVTTTYGYNNSLTLNELQTVSRSGQPTTYYGYDTNGDTTSITNTSTISTGLSYDRQARLVGVTLQDGTSVSQSYNSAGQRASYVVSKPGQPTLSERFQYRGEELGQAVVVTGTTTYTDTYLYTQDGAPLELLRQQNGTTNRYWYVLDGRGNVVALTDTSGNVVNRYAYELWGAPTSISETVPQQLRYAGYWYDQELGWYWVRVRSYDPVLKRWLQPDPSGIDGVRTYVYVGDNPIDSTDPTGYAVVFGNCGKSELFIVNKGGGLADFVEGMSVWQGRMLIISYSVTWLNTSVPWWEFWKNGGQVGRTFTYGGQYYTHTDRNVVTGPGNVVGVLNGWVIKDNGDFCVIAQPVATKTIT